MESKNMNIELNDILIGIAMIVFGLLVILLPGSLEILVGVAFIVVGLLKFVPDRARK